MNFDKKTHNCILQLKKIKKILERAETARNPLFLVNRCINLFKLFDNQQHWRIEFFIDDLKEITSFNKYRIIFNIIGQIDGIIEQYEEIKKGRLICL